MRTNSDPNSDLTPYRAEIERARALSSAHDEMKRAIRGVIVPEFNSIVDLFIKASFPWNIKVHGHGVFLNFGKPELPYTIAYYGYPEDNEFEIAVSSDHETTVTTRKAFQAVSPSTIKIMFEEFFNQYVPDLQYKAVHKSYEIRDLQHTGPYQLRIEDGDATSIITTVDEFDDMVKMAATLAKSFRAKDLIITNEDGSVIC